MMIHNATELEPFKNKKGIYCFINKLNPHRIYVGKANNLYKRIVYEHKYGTNYKTQYIDRVIRKYGLFEAFYIEVMHWWDEPVDNLEVLALETAIIDSFNSLVGKGGYNVCLFGFDRTGSKHTQKTRQKMSKNHTNRTGANNKNYDHTIYTFKNRSTKEIFKGTRYDFYTKYHFDKRSIDVIIWKRRPSSKNWILLPVSQNQISTPVKNSL